VEARGKKNRSAYSLDLHAVSVTMNEDAWMADYL
jgi:hypothetical protein